MMNNNGNWEARRVRRGWWPFRSEIIEASINVAEHQPSEAKILAKMLVEKDRELSDFRAEAQAYRKMVGEQQEERIRVSPFLTAYNGGMPQPAEPLKYVLEVWDECPDSGRWTWLNLGLFDSVEAALERGKIAVDGTKEYDRTGGELVEKEAA